MSEPFDFDTLSKPARSLCAAWFTMIKPGGSSGVTLHLMESTPTEKTKAALAELVAKGVISEERFNQYGGLVFKPLVDCFPLMQWMMEVLEGEGRTDPDIVFQIMRPVTEGDSPKMTITLVRS